MSHGCREFKGSPNAYKSWLPDIKMLSVIVIVNVGLFENHPALQQLNILTNLCSRIGLSNQSDSESFPQSQQLRKVCPKASQAIATRHPTSKGVSINYVSLEFKHIWAEFFH